MASTSLRRFFVTHSHERFSFSAQPFNSAVSPRGPFFRPVISTRLTFPPAAMAFLRLSRSSDRKSFVFSQPGAFYPQVAPSQRCVFEREVVPFYQFAPSFPRIVAHVSSCKLPNCRAEVLPFFFFFREKKLSSSAFLSLTGLVCVEPFFLPGQIQMTSFLSELVWFLVSTLLCRSCR